MKTIPLNLWILDDNELIVGQLSRYLNSRFGARVNIATFFDAHKCMESIDEKSHVIVLDYFLQDMGKGAKNGMKIFDAIKRQNPQTEVTLITSNKDVARATEEMKRGTSKYIMQKERYLYNVLHLFDKVVVVPIKTVAIPITKMVVFPIQKIIHYYNLKAYLMMFLVAFASVGIAVILGLLGLGLMHRL